MSSVPKDCLLGVLCRRTGNVCLEKNDPNVEEYTLNSRRILERNPVTILRHLPAVFSTGRFQCRQGTRTLEINKQSREAQTLKSLQPLCLSLQGESILLFSDQMRPNTLTLRSFWQRCKPSLFQFDAGPRPPSWATSSGFRYQMAHFRCRLKEQTKRRLNALLYVTEEALR